MFAHTSFLGLLFVVCLTVPPAVVHAQGDTNDAIARALACEEAEHRAWLHSMRVLDERYTQGTRQQLAAALRVANAAADPCDRAVDPVRAIAPGLADDIVAGIRAWEVLVDEGEEGELILLHFRQFGRPAELTKLKRSVPIVPGRSSRPRRSRWPSAPRRARGHGCRGRGSAVD
jgi:hypothetical protein